jgi:pyruvate/2-oxoglutarate dehydrogenase complex dihydrolipoamide dehydrogenase (E3) component
VSKSFDTIVIGAGPAGEAIVERLRDQQQRVALIERELVGGECAYWACIPSKTMLRAAEVLAVSGRVAGVERTTPRWRELASYRDYMIRGLDDSKQVDAYRRDGVEVYKGEATIRDRESVAVAGEDLRTQRIVIATGSEPTIPEIDGLSQNGFWTTRDATTLSELPASLAILGGGPVGVELAQFFARYGTAVTLVESSSRLVSGEDARMGELIADVLRAEGVEVRLDARVVAAASDGGARILRFADRSRVSADALLVAAGRRPRLPRCDPGALGAEVTDGRVRIDARCRVARGVYAIGDVTGVMPFTHVAKYQARIAARDIAGERVSARYDAIPRVTFSDPELAAVGLAEQQAREQHIDVASACIELSSAISRPSTYEREPRGLLGLLADRERGVLIGAWAAAPLAGEWINQAALAIRAKVPLRVLRDTVAPFPTFSEAYLSAVERLEPQILSPADKRKHFARTGRPREQQAAHPAASAPERVRILDGARPLLEPSAARLQDSESAEDDGERSAAPVSEPSQA